MQPEARTEYRQRKNIEGDTYREFVFQDMGYEGDSRLGIEVKRDGGLLRGRLWIEVAEKRDSLRSGPMVPSGIYASDEVWGYHQGDETRGWLFLVPVLRALHRAQHFREVTSRPGTSRGFELPIEYADMYCFIKKDYVTGKWGWGTVFGSKESLPWAA